MADVKHERKTVDMWIGSTLQPAVVVGGVTAGTKGTKDKFWLKLHINGEQVAEINEKFAAEIQQAHTSVAATRAQKLMEFGGASVPNAVEKSNAFCYYRDWCNPVVENGILIPNLYEVSVSQSSIDSQIKRGFTSLIKTKYYQVVDGKGHIIGSIDDPLNPAIPKGSKVAVKINMQVSASPNNTGFGLGMGRMAQVFIYEWGEAFGGGEDTMPEGVEFDASDAETELPEHVKNMMNRMTTKASASANQQVGNTATTTNPYGAQQVATSPYAAHSTPQTANPYGIASTAQVNPAEANPYAAQTAIDLVAEAAKARQQLFESEKIKYPTLTIEQFNTVHPL